MIAYDMQHFIEIMLSRRSFLTIIELHNRDHLFVKFITDAHVVQILKPLIFNLIEDSTLNLFVWRDITCWDLEGLPIER